MKRFILSIMAVFALGATAYAGEWNIDTYHTNAFFSVRHLMVSDVQGMFPEVRGVVSLNEKDITKSSVKVEIDVASVNTGVAQRDNHLKTADFFDLEKYNKMTFVSKRVTKNPDGTLAVTGDLTIRGVTKEVVLKVEGPTEAITDPWGNKRRGAKAYTVINRNDFGVSWNGLMDNGGLQVGTEVRITIDMEMTPKK
ncbi:MAG: YceI family protein [Deferribacterales bacterium]